MAIGTLLVIDDEPAITTLVARIAEASGYQVVATSDPEVFKREVEARSFDVICIDLSMPGSDGIDLLRLLASNACPSQLLIMSGSHPEMLESALRLGEALGLQMAGTVPKPLRIDAFRNHLTSLARRS